jgi:hypothetical protein
MQIRVVKSIQKGDVIQRRNLVVLSVTQLPKDASYNLATVRAIRWYELWRD